MCVYYVYIVLYIVAVGQKPQYLNIKQFIILQSMSHKHSTARKSQRAAMQHVSLYCFLQF